jgi:hypothetical protein
MMAEPTYDHTDAARVPLLAQPDLARLKTDLVYFLREVLGLELTPFQVNTLRGRSMRSLRGRPPG